MASIFQNLLDNVTWPLAEAGRGLARAKHQITEKQAVFPEVLVSANQAASESTSIATHLTTTSGGNYTITVSIPTLGVEYTTASVLWNADAATMEAALDTASPATVVDGDINVAEAGSAGLSDGACVFTCSGTVAEMPVTITVATVDLTGSGNGVGAVTRTTTGQPDRNAYQALYACNVVEGAGSAIAGASPTFTLPAAKSKGFDGAVSLWTIMLLADQLKVEEGNGTARTVLLDLYGLPESLYGPVTSVLS